MAEADEGAAGDSLDMLRKLSEPSPARQAGPGDTSFSTSHCPPDQGRVGGEAAHDGSGQRAPSPPLAPATPLGDRERGGTKLRNYVSPSLLDPLLEADCAEGDPKWLPMHWLGSIWEATPLEPFVSWAARLLPRAQEAYALETLSFSWRKRSRGQRLLRLLWESPTPDAAGAEAARSMQPLLRGLLRGADRPRGRQQLVDTLFALAPPLNTARLRVFALDVRLVLPRTAARALLDLPGPLAPGRAIHDLAAALQAVAQGRVAPGGGPAPALSRADRAAIAARLGAAAVAVTSALAAPPDPAAATAAAVLADSALHVLRGLLAGALVCVTVVRGDTRVQTHKLVPLLDIALEALGAEWGATPAASLAWISALRVEVAATRDEHVGGPASVHLGAALPDWPPMEPVCGSRRTLLPPDGHITSAYTARWSEFVSEQAAVQRREPFRALQLAVARTLADAPEGNPVLVTAGLPLDLVRAIVSPAGAAATPGTLSAVGPALVRDIEAFPIAAAGAAAVEEEEQQQQLRSRWDAEPVLRLAALLAHGGESALSGDVESGSAAFKNSGKELPIKETWEDQVATSPFLPLLKRTMEAAPKNASFCSSLSAFGVDFHTQRPMRASYLEALPAQAVGKALQTAQPAFTQVYQRRQRAFRPKPPTLPIPLTYALASPLYREVMVEAAAGLGLPPSENLLLFLVPAACLCQFGLRPDVMTAACAEDSLACLPAAAACTILLAVYSHLQYPLELHAAAAAEVGVRRLRRECARRGVRAPVADAWQALVHSWTLDEAKAALDVPAEDEGGPKAGVEPVPPPAPRAAVPACWHALWMRADADAQRVALGDCLENGAITLWHRLCELLTAPPQPERPRGGPEPRPAPAREDRVPSNAAPATGAAATRRHVGAPQAETSRAQAAARARRARPVEQSDSASSSNEPARAGRAGVRDVTRLDHLVASLPLAEGSPPRPEAPIVPEHAVELPWLSKPVLVLDLDQTLVHASSDEKAPEFFREAKALAGAEEGAEEEWTPIRCWLPPRRGCVPDRVARVREVADARWSRPLLPLVTDDWRPESETVIKLRRGALGFVSRVARRYTIVLYTKGEELYARSIALRIDPDGSFIGNRIISRDADVTVDSHKGLDAVERLLVEWQAQQIERLTGGARISAPAADGDQLPQVAGSVGVHGPAGPRERERREDVRRWLVAQELAGDPAGHLKALSSLSVGTVLTPEAIRHSCVVMDDRLDVWDAKEQFNVLPVLSYDFFLQVSAWNAVVHDRMDAALPEMLRALSYVARRYSDAHEEALRGLGAQRQRERSASQTGAPRVVISRLPACPDVPRALRAQLGTVLHGCHLTFSGLFRRNVDAAGTRLGVLAHKLGASIRPRVDDRTTHLVACVQDSSSLTDKVHRALQRRIPVVDPKWILRSFIMREKQNENMFCVPGVPQLHPPGDAAPPQGAAAGAASPPVAPSVRQ